MTQDKEPEAGASTQCDPSGSVPSMPYSLGRQPSIPPSLNKDTANADTGPSAAGKSIPVVSGQAIQGDWTHLDKQKILDRCEMLGLSLEKAVQLAVASDPADPNALLRLLDLDFSTCEPTLHRRPKRWLWMAARNSSVSYRGTLTEEALLDILTGGDVPGDFQAHIGHFLDETPVDMVVMAVAEAAQRSGVFAYEIWHNVTKLALRHSGYRRALWS
jgi:hypothetical protein